MSDGNRQRPSIDLDDLERQLRAVAQPRAAARPQPQPPQAEPAPLPFAVKPLNPSPLPENESFVAVEPDAVPPAVDPQPLPAFLAAATPKPAPRPADYDPLAELARIAQSGSDWSAPSRQDGNTPPSSPSGSAVDALEALLRMDPPVKAPPPSFAPLPPRRTEPTPTPMEGEQQPTLDFTVEPPPAAEQPAQIYAEAEPIYAPEGQLPPHDPAFVDDEPQPRPRSGMKLAAALVSVAAIGVGAVFFWRGGDGTPAGGGPRTPPVIKASNEPTKVAPANPGGMEVANSNQEMFAASKGNAPASATGKVVTTEEQPVDVNAGKPRVILPNGGSAATVPPAPPPPISTLPRDAKAPPSAPAPSAQPGNTTQAPSGMPALGEPKKVRTVLVRPDGTVIDGTEPVKPPSMAAAPSVLPTSPVPTQTLPPAAAAPPATGAPPPAIVPASPAPVAAEPTAQPAPGTPLPPRRPAVAAAAPDQTSAAPQTPAAPKPTAAPQPVAPQPAPAAATSVGTGDFAVQLAAPPTEQEARTLAARLAQRYGDTLAGQEPEIIRAEVNGKTLYRVRVTGLDRESANTMCNRIKSAQGSCFVAKN